eukprot:2138876-Rhodomonas_salina.1
MFERSQLRQRLARHKCVVDMRADHQSVFKFTPCFSHPHRVFKSCCGEALVFKPLAEREMQSPCRTGDAILRSADLINCIHILRSPLRRANKDSPIQS